MGFLNGPSPKTNKSEYSILHSHINDLRERKTLEMTETES